MYVGMRKNMNDKFNLERMPQCQIDFENQDVYFLALLETSGTFYLNYHYKNESDYKTCVQFDMPKSMMRQFYVHMFARSSGMNKLRFDLSAMTLSTDVENIGVSEFEAKYDENVPKLFKFISFFKNNLASLNKYEEDLKKQEFDIPTMHNMQSMVFSLVDFSNTQLSKSLEETDTIKAYVDNQNFATDEMGKMVVDALSQWLGIVEKQYETMNKDISKIIKEIENFNFDGLYRTTDDLLTNLNTKLKNTNQDFKAFKKFSRLIGKNLKTLQKKKDELKALPKLIKKMLKKKKGGAVKVDQSLLVGLLLFLGLFIVLALLCILCKVGNNARKNILG